MTISCILIFFDLFHSYVMIMIISFTHIPLECYHQYERHMRLMVSQITTNLTFSSTACSCYHENIFKALHNWYFVRAIDWWLVDSPQEGSLLQKVFPLHDLIMFQNWCPSAMAQIAKMEGRAMATLGSAFVLGITSEIIVKYVSKYVPMIWRLSWR